MPHNTVTFYEADFYRWAESIGLGACQHESRYWTRMPADQAKELEYWDVPKHYLPMGITAIHAISTRPQATCRYTFHVTFASEAAATLVALGRD